MKQLKPFFKAYYQTAAPFFVLLAVVEFIKPGFVQSRVHMTTFFLTITLALIITNARKNNVNSQDR